MPNTSFTLPEPLGRVRSRAIVVAPGALIVGLVLSFIIGGGSAETFFQGYLYSFVLVVGLGLGSLALLMVHHMTAGEWSFISQRVMEAATRTIPFLGLMFVPILFGPLLGLHHLYEAWVHPHSDVIESKAAFLNVQFWALRCVAYFVIWSFIQHRFNSWSKRLEETGDGLIVLKMRRWAPLSLITYCLTMTFAALDWVMSLEPEWFSTIYGPLFWMSQVLITFTCMIILMSYLTDVKPLSRYITNDHFHQHATFMLVFILLWAYMSFSQFLIIWAGNLPEEIHWYLQRSSDGFTALTVCLIVFHFFVPLLILLHRKAKFNIKFLRKVCCGILFMRFVDVFWIVNPAFHHGDTPGIYWQDIVVYAPVLVGVSALWVWYFLGQLTRLPLLPLNDPRLYEALQENVDEEALEHA